MFQDGSYGEQRGQIICKIGLEAFILFMAFIEPSSVQGLASMVFVVCMAFIAFIAIAFIAIAFIAFMAFIASKRGAASDCRVPSRLQEGSRSPPPPSPTNPEFPNPSQERGAVNDVNEEPLTGPGQSKMRHGRRGDLLHECEKVQVSGLWQQRFAANRPRPARPPTLYLLERASAVHKNAHAGSKGGRG